MGRTATIFFCLTKPQNSLKLLFFGNCANLESFTLVKHASIFSMHSDTKDTGSTGLCSITASQGAFNRSYVLFIHITTVSIAVSVSRRWQTLLHAWRLRNESLAVFILWMHYPSGQIELGQTFCSSSGYASLHRDGRKTHCASRRTTFRSASFKTYLEGKFVQTHNASCARLYNWDGWRITRRTTNVCPSSSRQIMRP